MAAALWRALFGLLAGGVTAFVAGAPILIETVAGLALLNAFGSALHNALADTQDREPALIAFLVTTSGVVIYDVGGAFWDCREFWCSSWSEPAPRLSRDIANRSVRLAICSFGPCAGLRTTAKGADAKDSCFVLDIFRNRWHSVFSARLRGEK